tara:strand:- start:4420 stop:4773 length:354 start_codon:yes stop_codon:yes gene_type:complete
MKKEDITVEHITHICRLYEKHLGGHSIDDYFQDPHLLEEITECIRKNGGSENERIGSNYQYDTKFGFTSDLEENVIPDVNLNFDPQFRKGAKYEEAKQTVETFLEEATAYLKEEAAK